MENKSEIKRVVATAREIYTDFNYKQLTSGHINQTYLIDNNGEQLILQKLNPKVFTNLQGISKNIVNIAEHLIQKQYPHQILQQVAFDNGSYLFEEHWRIFKFIENTQSFLKVQSSTQAYEAAKFLSSFHAHLADMSLERIEDSIDGFLDFEMRRQHYEDAIQNAALSRLKKAEDAIQYANDNRNILEDWLTLLPQIPTRIIHADPKISNFLFDKTNPNQILALIDWDTFMQGSILYDFGDMVRSYTNLKEEDDPEFGNNFSLENYRAIEDGFLYHLKNKLTSLEIANLALGAQVVIYVQAIRFLTDYLNEDVYYTTYYPEQNLNRALSQINLLTEFNRQLLIGNRD